MVPFAAPGAWCLVPGASRLHDALPLADRRETATNACALARLTFGTDSATTKAMAAVMAAAQARNGHSHQVYACDQDL